MKVFCILFAFLLSALTCYPCTDEETCSADHKSEVSVISHDHGKDEVDSCSPLCVCSCCSVKINSPTTFHFEIYLPEFVVKNTAHFDVFTKQVVYTIWQPPKLS